MCEGGLRAFTLFEPNILDGFSWISDLLMLSCKGEGVFSDAFVPILDGLFSHHLNSRYFIVPFPIFEMQPAIDAVVEANKVVKARGSTNRNCWYVAHAIAFVTLNIALNKIPKTSHRPSVSDRCI